ncbi:MAG: hypothetical protein ABSH13_08645 [Candidatus Acidiferrum sp.]|jgi:hypothetical protein
MTGLDDATTLRTLHILATSFSIAMALGLFALLFPRAGQNTFGRIERAFTDFSERKALAILTLFLSVIAIRLLALPLLHVPVPGIHDEFSYLLMSDTFAHGRLANPTHPMWVSFETFHVNWFPTYSSMYPPAQGFALAIGQLLGNPWIGVLLSDAAMCAVILWMLQAWLPARWAFLGGAIVALKLGIASYWMNSYWGGAMAALGGALVLGSLARIVKRARVRDALLLGSGIAILANSRPYEGFLFCLPAAGWFLWWLIGSTKSKDALPVRLRRVVAPVTILLVLTAAWMGYYNYRLTGNALLMPHVLNTRTYHTAPLFLWEYPKPEMHYRNQQFEDFYNGWERENYHNNRADVIRVSWEKLFRGGITYFWLGLLLALPALPFVLRDRKMRLPLITVVIGMAGVFVVIWSAAHYAAPITCAHYLLVVQAIRHVRTMHISARPIGRALSRAIILALVLDTGMNVACGACDPLLWPCEGDPSRTAIAEKLDHTPGKHLIIVRYTEDHNIHDDWVYNGAEIDNAKVLWARELNPEQNAKLLAYFNDRKVWLVTPDTDNTYLEPYTPPGGPLAPEQ